MRPVSSGTLLTILTVLLILSTAQGVFMYVSENGVRDAPLNAYGEAILSRLLTDVDNSLLLSTSLNNTTTLSTLLPEVENLVAEDIRGQVLKGGGRTFRVLSLNVTILPIYSGVALPRWSLYGLEGDICSVYRSSPSPIPVGITIHGEYRVAELGGRVVEGDVLHDHYTPLLAVLDGLWSLQRDAEGGSFSGMIQEMLNAIVRIRISTGIGYRNGDSVEDLLSPLDVELAVNFALILEEISAFGVSAAGALEALDNFFYNVSKIYSDEGDLNPTGYRVWSENEREAYREYMYRRLTFPDPAKRRVENLLGGLKGGAVVDPVDLFLLYLFYDRFLEGQGVAVNPYDGRGILSEGPFSNPRDAASRVDPANPNLLLALPGERVRGGILEGSVKPVGFTGNMTPVFVIKREPEYLVVGKDIKVSGLYSPRGWYTNAVLNTTAAGGGTRCGGVPPPPTPLDHDFRIWWNLKINVSASYAFSTPSGLILLKKVLNLSADAGVFGWYSQRPTFPAQEVSFWNVNTGGVVQGQNYSMVILISPAANATEYFLQYIWQVLRFPVAWGHLTAMLGRETLMGRDVFLSSLSTLSIMWGAGSAFKTLPVEDLYKSVSVFLLDYIFGENLQLQDLGYIEEDSFNITLNYDPYLDMLTVAAHPIYDVNTVVRIEVSGPLQKKAKRIVLEVLTRRYEDTFKSTASLFGENITSFRLTVDKGDLTYQLSFLESVWGVRAKNSSTIQGLPLSLDSISCYDGVVLIHSSLNTSIPHTLLKHYILVNRVTPTPILTDLHYPLPATITLPLKTLLWWLAGDRVLLGEASLSVDSVEVCVVMGMGAENEISGVVYLVSQ